MKKIFITSFLFIISIAPGFAQIVFTVINVELVKEAYSIVTARDIYGRTIQFQVGIRNLISNKTDKKIVKPSKPPIIGSMVTALFIPEKPPVANYEGINYKLIQPVYIEDNWHTIVKIDSSTSLYNNHEYAKITMALWGADSTLFKIWRPFPPDINHFMGMVVYKANYNKSQYFIFKPYSQVEIIKNIFYSYPVIHPVDNSQASLPFQIPKSDKWRIELLAGGANRYPYPQIQLYYLPDSAKFKGVIFELNTDYDLFQFTQLRKSPFQILLKSGYYTLELSGKRIDTIALLSGSYTDIYNGALKMISNTPWTLYDENKLKKIYSSLGSEMVIFPIGIYQLQINDSFHQIDIKDGKTYEYTDTTSPAQTQRLTTSDDKKWEIKQNLLAKGVTGKLFLNIQKDAECVITISQPVTERQVSYSINERSFSLVPGTFDVTISGSKVKDVPVQKGMDTRIKAGILNVVASGTWTLYDEKKDRQVYYSTSPKKIGLPIGTYQMDINGTMQQVVIKDRETVDF